VQAAGSNLGPAAASTLGFPGASNVVFVQTDNTAGNHVVAYQRAADGTLSPVGSYATGGLSGILAGSVVDHTASQLIVTTKDNGNCPHCTEYLAQMRETIRLTGRLAPEDLTPQMRDDFVDLYRRWRSEQQ
jgi:hypothetical protein